MMDTSRLWACIAGGTCSVGLYAAVLHVLPVLQLVAVILTIVATLKSLFMVRKA